MAIIYYGNSDDFLTYCNDRNYAVGSWSPSPSDEIEGALLRASVYIDGRYRSGFSGTRTDGRSQTREWPRYLATDAEGIAIDKTEIPIEVTQATYEAAFRELETPFSLMPDYVGTDRVKKEQVGSLAVEYDVSSSKTAKDSWPVIGTIDAIMASLIGVTPSRLFGDTTRI